MDQGAKDSLETTSMSGVWPLGSDFRYVLYGLEMMSEPGGGGTF
jgi:hypothetical protein